MDTPVASVQNLTGNWHLELMNGVNINLILSQSDSLVSGRGNVTSGNASQEAKAIGSYSSNVLKMNVVPVSGKEHYALSLDLSGQIPVACYSCCKFAVALYPDSIHSSKDKYLLPVTQSSLISIIIQPATLRSD